MRKLLFICSLPLLFVACAAEPAPKPKPYASNQSNAMFEQRVQREYQDYLREQQPEHNASPDFQSKYNVTDTNEEQQQAQSQPMSYDEFYQKKYAEEKRSHSSQ
ncbi:hypothetical protein JD969_20540 [Planctomycetota bacterium]|nr:hypothetical protein JD969_20540 [Planctomycetota bacterium]